MGGVVVLVKEPTVVIVAIGTMLQGTSGHDHLQGSAALVGLIGRTGDDLMAGGDGVDSVIDWDSDVGHGPCRGGAGFDLMAGADCPAGFRICQSRCR